MDPTITATALTCDDSIKAKFKPDNLTTVLLVASAFPRVHRCFYRVLRPETPIAANDVCLGKAERGSG